MWLGFLILSFGCFAFSGVFFFLSRESKKPEGSNSVFGSVRSVLGFVSLSLLFSSVVFCFLYSGGVPGYVLPAGISIVAGAVLGYAGCRLALRYRNRRSEKRLLSSVQMGTVGIFLSVVLLFVPIYYAESGLGDSYGFLRPLLISLHSALRVFILDGEFTVISSSVPADPVWLHVAFTFYAALLYVISPLLMFGNLLSLFKNIWGEFRYLFHRYCDFYIMSELNVKSIALARSIREKNPKAILVFTDVFEQNEEGGYELLTEAKGLNAICFRKDVTHLDLLSKKGNVEIFLIAENEAENISQAVRITTYLNRKNSKQNVKIFAFSRSTGGACIIDSVRYENLLAYAERNGYGDRCFKLRRVNEIRNLVWNTVPDMKVFDLALRRGGKLSVMIAGMGSYGFEFFKTLLWFCQFEGIRLQINVIDRQGAVNGGKCPIRSLFDRQCPDLMKNNRSQVYGDAYYDVEILSGVDLETSAFDDLVFYQGPDEEKKYLSQRLRKTDLAIVSLGDDDLNVEAAVHLRSLFDRVNGTAATPETDVSQERVQIYSIVYDEQKSGVLQSDRAGWGSSFLINHKNVPYNIHFIGGMSSQFSYGNVYNRNLEVDAFRHHVQWLNVKDTLRKEWGVMSQNEKVQPNLKEEMGNYERFEYYRLSSVATELYERAIAQNKTLSEKVKCSEGSDRHTCRCENCLRHRRCEHMRWIAYTRTVGYSYQDGIRNDRAMLHNDLCGWNDLPDFEKQKDG